MNTAIILFGGIGTRFGSDLPKQFFLVDGKPLCYYTIKSFNSAKEIDNIVLVIDESIKEKYEEIVHKYSFNKVCLFVQGGNTRQESSYKGIIALKDILTDNDKVLIHDGARPLVDEEIISANIKALEVYDGVVTALKSEDSMMISNGKTIANYLERNDTFRVQTPQSFKYGVIKEAHIQNIGKQLTDDAQLLMAMNKEVGIVIGNKKLGKITTKEDIEQIKEYLK